MHDTVIASSIMKFAQRRAGKRKVKSVALDVGELAPVEAQEIAQTLKTITGWKVEARPVKAFVACSCTYKGAPKILERGHDFVLFECPKCGNVPEIREGGEIRVKEVGF